MDKGLKAGIGFSREKTKAFLHLDLLSSFVPTVKKVLCKQGEAVVLQSFLKLVQSPRLINNSTLYL